jgi:hypothetical protein
VIVEGDVRQDEELDKELRFHIDARVDEPLRSS